MLGVLGRWLNPINPKLDVKYKKTIPFSMKPYVLYPYYHAIKEGVNERLKPALPPLDRVQVLYPLGRASSVTTSVTTFCHHICRYTAGELKREEAYGRELKRQKEMWGQAEKARREQWVADKTKEIKEATVRGLEPNIL